MASLFRISQSLVANGFSPMRVGASNSNTIACATQSMPASLARAARGGKAPGRTRQPRELEFGRGMGRRPVATSGYVGVKERETR